MCKGINNITLPVYKELMKKIENETLSKIEVSNIQSMTDEELDKLKVGDVIQKKTGNKKHCYVVSYKEEHHGICLTYVDCGYMETISYDYTDGHWVFNSKDVCETLTERSLTDNDHQFDGDIEFAGQVNFGASASGIGTINETLSLAFPRITLREDGEIYSASTSHEFTTNEYSKLADDGIAIMMFNGTSIVFPYVKGTTSTDGISRLVGCVVYDDSGNSMVSRIKFNLRYDSEVSKYYANIDLDENTAQAMYLGFDGQPPYVVMKFYKLG